jgi:hypothetical protein
MNAIEKIELRREAILTELRSIRSMKRGGITEQFYSVRHKGKKEPVKRGPYYVFAKWENGKTVSRRLTSKADVEKVQGEIESHKRFVELCREFAQLTERLGELESSVSEMDGVKKTPKSSSRRTRK